MVEFYLVVIGMAKRVDAVNDDLTGAVKRARVRSSVDQTASSSSSTTHACIRTLCLRGLNIQWPFSQLVLLGYKTKEIRNYDLGHRSIAFRDEDRC